MKSAFDQLEGVSAGGWGVSGNEARQVTVAIQVEAYTVVVRKQALQESYPDGAEGFLRDCPNRTCCVDGNLACVSFSHPNAVHNEIVRLEKHGLVHRDANGCAKDIVVIDQFRGPLSPCAWVEVLAARVSGCDIVVCRLAGTNEKTVVLPGMWRPEHSKPPGFMQLADFEKYCDVVAVEDGVMTIRDRRTGQIYYAPVIESIESAGDRKGEK